MDLVLNNQQRLICHETQLTNHSTSNEKRNIQTLIYPVKTVVIQSKSMQYCKLLFSPVRSSSSFYSSLYLDVAYHVSLDMLYNCNTNTSGNIIKHSLQTSMNERTHFFIKIYLSHFILEWVDVSVVCERWVERHILKERTSSSHIFFQETGGFQRLHPFESSLETLLIGCMSLARLRSSALCPNLTA